MKCNINLHPKISFIDNLNLSYSEAPLHLQPLIRKEEIFAMLFGILNLLINIIL